jgi:hypothetical protein
MCTEVLLGTPEGKRPLGNLGIDGGNIQIDVQEVGLGA